MLKYRVTIELDTVTGKATVTNGEMATDPVTNAVLQKFDGIEKAISDGKALGEVLVQAAGMFAVIMDNGIKDDLDTSIIESVIVASGVMDKIMNRLGNMVVHLKNGDVSAAVSSDLGMFIASVDALAQQSVPDIDDEVDDAEMARRRAIMIPHPDGGA